MPAAEPRTIALLRVHTCLVLRSADGSIQFAPEQAFAANAGLDLCVAVMPQILADVRAVQGCERATYADVLQVRHWGPGGRRTLARERRLPRPIWPNGVDCCRIRPIQAGATQC